MDMQQPATAFTTPPENETLSRLASIEALLAQQSTQAKRRTRYSLVRTVATLLLLVVVAVGLFQINHTISTALEGLPELITTTQESVTELSTQMQTVLEDIEKVDFDALSESIRNLQTVTESLRKVAEFFGT